MKKVLAIVLTACMVMGLTACGNEVNETSNEVVTNAEETGTEMAAKGKVGFINHDLNDPFQQFMLLGGKETAEALGYEFVSGSAENDPIKEQDLINNFASQGVTLLVLGSTTKASGETAIDLAHELGMKVVTMDSIQEDSKADCQVGGDDIAAGYIAGIQLAEAMGGEGEVAIAKYPAPIPPSDDRVIGFYKAFDEYPGITVIAEDGPDADQMAAQTWAIDIIQAHPDVKGFISIMDVHGLGIVRGVENAGKEDSVSVVTVVESEDSYTELKNEGTPLKCVVAMHSYNYGAISVFALDRLENGRPAPSIIKTTGVAVTTENVDFYMDLIKAQSVN
jgi:ABC-type sugar transport system substrate-binding protein